MNFFLFRMKNEILKTSPLYREIFHIRQQGIFKFSEIRTCIHFVKL